jgi:MarR family transcriptional regulator, organic hydroperoxide resistance regulator
MTPSSLVDPPDATRIWFRFLRLRSRMDIVLSEHFKTIGLSIPQGDVLATLTEKEGISQQELAIRLYVTKGNISGLLDRLSAAGLVERRMTPGDRRSHAIYLTAEGRAAALKGIAIQKEFISSTFGHLSIEDMIHMEKLMIQVRNKIREYGTDVQIEDKFTKSR